MPAFIVWLLGALAPLLQTVAGRVLVLLGFSAVTFTGFNTLLDALKSQVVAAWGGMPADLSNVLAMLRIDQAILIVFGAYASRVAMNAVQGAITRFVNVGPKAGT